MITKKTHCNKFTTFAFGPLGAIYSPLLGNEGFLSDGIIVLGLRRKQGRISRHLQIEKMRMTSHTMEKHVIDVGQ